MRLAQVVLVCALCAAAPVRAHAGDGAAGTGGEPGDASPSVSRTAPQGATRPTGTGTPGAEATVDRGAEAPGAEATGAEATIDTGDGSNNSPLGSYERDALAQALARRHLTIDRHPEGKIVRRILVVNLPVFGHQEGFLRWFNVFHVTSRKYVVSREVLLRPGQVWDEELVDETRRRLRDPLFTSLAVVEPVVAEGGAKNEVDLLVVTRDIWSLRTNLNYEIQESSLTRLSVSLSENNLFGLHKQVALVFDMDQGAFAIGPQYIDKNLAGRHLQLLAKWDAVFGRVSGSLEGSTSYTSFSYPLWSLETPWGAGITATHYDAIARSFLGTSLRSYDNPDTPDVEEVPWEYRERDVDVESSVIHQLGHAVKSRIAAGHRLSIHRPSVLDTFPGDDMTRAAFERDVLPRSERSSALFLRYSLFTPRYVVYRNIDTFDLPEDAQLGPQLSLEVAAAPTFLGSERTFETAAASAAWTFDLASDGVVQVAASASGRLEKGDLIDNLVSASVSGATPTLLGARLAWRFLWSRRYNETSNHRFILGGDSGLRGYQIGAFIGTGPEQVRVLGNLEVRSLPIKVLFTRAGGVLFYDAGHAADCYRGCTNQLAMYQDVGLGVRLLLPQLQPAVFRFDYALPLNGPTAGLPGRFIAGFKQVF